VLFRSGGIQQAEAALELRIGMSVCRHIGVHFACVRIGV